MPRKGPSAKRKVSEDDADDAKSEDELETRNARSKKPKTSTKAETSKAEPNETSASVTGLAENGQPTNKTMPSNIAFPPKPEGSIRIASWNVSGLAAARKKVESLSSLHGRLN